MGTEAHDAVPRCRQIKDRRRRRACLRQARLHNGEHVSPPPPDRCATILQAAGCTQSYGAWNCLQPDSTGVNLTGADLSGCDLSGSGLPHSTLSRANLAGAALRGTNFFESSLDDADLTGADLSYARLYSSNLSNAKFANANLTDVSWDSAVCPDGERISADGTCCGRLIDTPSAGCPAP